jgi:signal transduction histidine kinase
MKVFVVDDSHFNLSVVKRYLEEITEISQILLCDDSREVKSILDTYHIDILISDIMMPAITGFDLLETLRSDHMYDDMPIIMLTSLNDIESYKKCFELGAFDYINKPISGIELNARIKVAIEAKNNSNHLKALIEVTQRQNEELKIINAMLNEAKFSLVQSEKMAAIGQLAAGLAHEINNPLGYVSSNFEVLHQYYSKVREFIYFYNMHFLTNNMTDGSNDKNNLEEVNLLYKQLKLDRIIKDMEDIFMDTTNGIQRITDIVQSLRVFSRSSKDDEKDTHTLLDLMQQVIIITTNEVKYVASTEINVPEDIILYCNRIQICQVFVNMIINAAQAIKSQQRDDLGLIRISAKKLYNDIIIRIEDNGPGIPKEYMPKIFEPFFTTKEIGQGTGLGLSISYDIIVNKHNGIIDVKSEPGKGAIFTIILPIITSQ